MDILRDIPLTASSYLHGGDWGMKKKVTASSYLHLLWYAVTAVTSILQYGVPVVSKFTFLVLKAMI